MRKFSIILTGLILISALSANAFDGKRQGFILGGGIGFSPTVRIESGEMKQDEPGLGWNLMIGFAWDHQNMLVWEANMAAYSKARSEVWQGTSTITWYHYFESKKPGFFTVAGLGLFNYASTSDWGWLFADEHDAKTGFLFGGGYEFSRHWQLGLYISNGKTEEDNVEYDHTNVSLLICGVAF